MSDVTFRLTEDWELLAAFLDALQNARLATEPKYHPAAWNDDVAEPVLALARAALGALEVEYLDHRISGTEFIDDAAAHVDRERPGTAGVLRALIGEDREP